ncbi:hypothetical protein TGRH88_076250 [Toxoplasma gondii]|uniref:Uncharacterized protein n=1 Tax=Toxoplasma gondii TaxID=5811 RepID=A0A7J6K2Z2_TOXGO|nr:hypothetical protein TGRH88_076250 [Toxoplasma gondii]
MSLLLEGVRAESPSTASSIDGSDRPHALVITERPAQSARTEAGSFPVFGIFSCNSATVSPINEDFCPPSVQPLGSLVGCRSIIFSLPRQRLPRISSTLASGSVL